MATSRFRPPSALRSVLLRDTALVALLTAFGSTLLVIRDLIVAAVFGTSGAADAFVLSNTIVLFVGTICGNAFATALTPPYMLLRHQNQRRNADALVGSYFGYAAVVLCIATAAIAIGAPLFVPLLTKRFSAGARGDAVTLTRILAPAIVLMGLAAIANAVANAAGRFASSTLAMVIGRAALVVVLIASIRSLGVVALAVATMVAALLELGLRARDLVRHHETVRPSLQRDASMFRASTRQFGAIFFGSILASGTGIVDQVMAGRYGQGNIAALAYGSKVVTLVVSFVGPALATTLLPHFSAMVARGDVVDARLAVRRQVAILLAAGLPLSAALAIASTLLIRLLFQRGAFTGLDTELVSKIQRALVAQLPFGLASIPLTRVISSMNANRFLMWGAALTLFFDITLNYAFGHYWGVVGIAWSTTAVSIITFGFLWMMQQRLWSHTFEIR